MANLQAANNTELKNLWGSTVRTALMEEKHKVITTMKGTWREYNKECKGRNPEEHKKGPPSLHVGSAMLSGLLQDEKVTGQIKADLQTGLELLQGMSVNEASLHIKLCKVGKCWKEGTVKIQFHFTEKLEMATWKALEAAGATMKHGRAPAGTLGRTVTRLTTAP